MRLTALIFFNASLAIDVFYSITFSCTNLGRIWKVAGASGVGATVPLPGVSVALDFGLLTTERNFYKSQLGLPQEDSDEFRKLTPEIQEKVRKFHQTLAVNDIGQLFAGYTASAAVEEFTRYIPFVGSAIAGSISFSSTYYVLNRCLRDLEETALNLLDEINAKVADDMELD